MISSNLGQCCCGSGGSACTWPTDKPLWLYVDIDINGSFESVYRLEWDSGLDAYIGTVFVSGQKCAEDGYPFFNYHPLNAPVYIAVKPRTDDPCDFFWQQSWYMGRWEGFPGNCSMWMPCVSPGHGWLATAANTPLDIDMPMGTTLGWLANPPCTPFYTETNLADFNGSMIDGTDTGANLLLQPNIRIAVFSTNRPARLYREPLGYETFRFDIDAEGWVSSTFSGTTTGGWIGTDGNPDAGCYEVNSFGLNTHTDYADWYGTFEDLGVPSGTTVTGITLTSVRTKIVEVGTSGAVGVGPFYLSEPDGTNIATLWAGRSSSTNETSWTTSSGTEQTISLPSNTSIRLQFFTSLDSGISTITMTARYDSIAIELEFA
jgi:hypothetical protein